MAQDLAEGLGLLLHPLVVQVLLLLLHMPPPLCVLPLLARQSGVEPRLLQVEPRSLLRCPTWAFAHLLLQCPRLHRLPHLLLGPSSLNFPPMPGLPHLLLGRCSLNFPPIPGLPHLLLGSSSLNFLPMPGLLRLLLGQCSLVRRLLVGLLAPMQDQRPPSGLPLPDLGLPLPLCPYSPHHPRSHLHPHQQQPAPGALSMPWESLPPP